MISDFTDKFLSYSRITLFILFAMATSSYYTSESPIPGYITTICNLVGGISVIAWVYAIGQHANEKLQRQEVELNMSQFLDFAFIAVIVSAFTMSFLYEGDIRYGRQFQITYTSPGEVSLVFCSALIFIFVVTAKSLVSAEKKKDATFKEYFPTLLLFLIPWLGVWWIQPRVKKL